MKSMERRKNIIEILNKNKKMSIKEISKIIGEKENNIRRDIRILNDMGLLTKKYGSIQVIGNNKIIDKFFFPSIQNNSEKEAIAKKAYEFINNDESILLSSGTTVYQLAKILYESDITLNIITLSLPIAALLSGKKNYNLILIGGKLIHENMSFEGSIVNDMLKYYHINKAFIGVRGFSIEHGFTIPAMEQVVTTRAVADSSDEIYVLADYSKFYTKCLIKMSTFNDDQIRRKIKRVITNKELEEKYINRLKQQGIEVFVV